MLALMKPKNAVTVSIIATVLSAPVRDRNDTRGRTVKRISNRLPKSDPTDDSEQHRGSGTEVKAGYFGCSVFGRAASCARAAIIASYSGVPRRGGVPSGRPPIQCGMSASDSPGVRPPAQADSPKQARHRKAHRRAAEQFI